jgi:hypothetical protein
MPSTAMVNFVNRYYPKKTSYREETEITEAIRSQIGLTRTYPTQTTLAHMPSMTCRS